MERTHEVRYSDLLRQLAGPSVIEAAVLAESLRQVEYLHSMGHITNWQMGQAREAYGATIARVPGQGAPRSPETRADDR